MIIYYYPKKLQTTWAPLDPQDLLVWEVWEVLMKILEEQKCNAKLPFTRLIPTKNLAKQNAMDNFILRGKSQWKFWISKNAMQNFLLGWVLAKYLEQNAIHDFIFRMSPSKKSWMSKMQFKTWFSRWVLAKYLDEQIAIQNFIFRMSPSKKFGWAKCNSSFSGWVLEFGWAKCNSELHFQGGS